MKVIAYVVSRRPSFLTWMQIVNPLGVALGWIRVGERMLV
jgi:hypothetical protein